MVKQRPEAEPLAKNGETCLSPQALLIFVASCARFWKRGLGTLDLGFAKDNGTEQCRGAAAGLGAGEGLCH